MLLFQEDAGWAVPQFQHRPEPAQQQSRAGLLPAGSPGLLVLGATLPPAVTAPWDVSAPHPMARTSHQAKAIPACISGEQLPLPVSIVALMDGSVPGTWVRLFSQCDSWETSTDTKYMTFVTTLSQGI